MATPSSTVVRLVLRFVPPRELGRTASANRTWQTASDIQWKETLGRADMGDKDRMNLLLSARQHRQRLRRWHDAFIGRDRACSRLAKAFKKPARVMIFLGLLTTMILGVIEADSHKNWPSWRVPVPMVIFGAPLVGRLFMSLCALLMRCHLRRRTRQERRVLLESMACSRAQFHDMTAVLDTSQSLVVRLQQARDDVEGLGVPHLAPVEASFGIRLWEVPILALWVSALLLLLPLPLLLQVAPLYCGCIVTSLLPGKFYKRMFPFAFDYDGGWFEEAFPIGLARLSFVLLAASIFLFCLQVNGLFHSAITVAASFWLFLAVTGVCASFTVFQTGDEWPDDVISCVMIVGCCTMCLTTALASASIGVAAVLDKVTGGLLAVIPYTVIVFVLLLCLPPCCCLCAYLWVGFTTLDDD